MQQNKDTTMKEITFDDLPKIIDESFHEDDLYKKIHDFYVVFFPYHVEIKDDENSDISVSELARAWCKKKFKNPLYHTYNYKHKTIYRLTKNINNVTYDYWGDSFYFKNSKDAMLFKLACA
jgi:hypothetical protein